MEPIDAPQEAIKANDAADVARVLEEHPALKARIDPLPGGSFGQTALLAAVQHANREMVDVLATTIETLLAAGARGRE